MTIENKKVVSVNYTLTSKQDPKESESIVEKTTPGEPFVFLFGSGGLIAGFENNLRGKKKGETFDFHIKPEDAYGALDPSYVITIPIEAFKNDKGEIDRAALKVGEVLPMMDNQGNHLQGTVKEVKLDSVVMDFNHPLAGHELHFIGEILDIREASEEELAHGHVHGPGGHHH
jgi:FKBP-type peptidyl-prolyl cis-trans isomerase SlyD